MIRLRALWCLFAIVHAIAAGYAWHMLAHGFPIGHLRFWSNEAIPIGFVVASIACVVALVRGSWWAAVPIAAIAALHVGLAFGWWQVFPLTGGKLAVYPAVSGLVLVVFAAAALREAKRTAIAVGAVLGLAAGYVCARAQRGADPATHPVSPVLATPDASVTPTFPDWVMVNAAAGAIRIANAGVEVDISPLLTFYSRSPDRGWTLLADVADRIGPERLFSLTAGDTAFYAGDEPATLRATMAGDTLAVEANAVLKSAVYSHLNSFTVIRISGHHHLSIGFSSVADPIDVTYSEYPTGKPSRFAYLDADRVFHVVQSTSGEKGPFHELGHGTLDGPLGLTLFDAGKPIAHLDFADFAAQASTQLSPTAGWGVPENAIEFSLVADSPTATASIYITLAATSVGRGFDSVGHAPGGYRNRIQIRR